MFLFLFLFLLQHVVLDVNKKWQILICYGWHEVNKTGSGPGSRIQQGLVIIEIKFFARR